MEYTHLGSTGVTISRLCLGTSKFGSKVNKELSTEILDMAFDEGINFWDTADIYGREDPLLNWSETSGRSERVVGDWIEASNSRDHIVLNSKVRWPPKFSINFDRSI